MIWVFIGFVVLILMAFPITLILLLFPEPVKDKGLFYLLRLISRIWFLLCGWRLKIYAKPLQQPCIYLINHQSYLDAAMIYTCLPPVFKTLGKVDIEKVPIYGLIYKSVVITVNRASAGDRAGSFRRMQRELNKGYSIAIFPEGTFPDQPQDTLLPFQQGPFHLAHVCNMDLQPVLFPDTGDRMSPKGIGPFYPGPCRAVFLPPISINKLPRECLPELRTYLRDYMQMGLDISRKKGPEFVWEAAREYLHDTPFRYDLR